MNEWESRAKQTKKFELLSFFLFFFLLMFFSFSLFCLCVCVCVWRVCYYVCTRITSVVREYIIIIFFFSFLFLCAVREREIIVRDSTRVFFFKGGVVQEDKKRNEVRSAYLVWSWLLNPDTEELNKNMRISKLKKKKKKETPHTNWCRTTTGRSIALSIRQLPCSFHLSSSGAVSVRSEAIVTTPVHCGLCCLFLIVLQKEKINEKCNYTARRNRGEDLFLPVCWRIEAPQNCWLHRRWAPVQDCVPGPNTDPRRSCNKVD